ncbi:RluA family pseudouridine synthase [Thalassotalea mangrovi]|uniref:RluA family pseudouridine synthase n=1 Tax=Thalassotalea mangrovi TaxID=2572245 RepID=A0A4U1BBV9_9GAMM|nr:RluA family pseudouridine synthase [Thalassotalea mangrovi]TKB47509.1 RluA family pseudouridine synthase [Thalassotalea mangrovi]
MSENILEIHHNVETDADTAVSILTAITPLSAGKIKQAMQKGCVWLTSGSKTSRLRRANRILAPGQQLHLYYNDVVLAQQVEPARLVTDAGDYSVWYKPFGMLSQGSKWSDHTTITRFVEQTLDPQRPCLLVHRLDRATSGLIVVSHTKSSTRALTSAFEGRKTRKRYHAIVCGNASELTGFNVENELDGRHAVSVITCLDYQPDTNRSMVEVEIKTGRKHQIRRHLSQLKLPIVGDRLYSATDDGWDESENLQLCSVYLAFPAPGNGELKEFHLPPTLDIHLS